MFVVFTSRGPMISMKFLRSIIAEWIRTRKSLSTAVQIETRMRINAILADGEAYADELKRLTAAQRKALVEKVVRKLRTSLAETLALAKHEKVLARREQREGEAKAENAATDA
ncbi:hypothetical protein K431DRAFT_19073 [Polychaeton citri CBS 116435]|uniref:Uncharacterized protein n=1 Tax=Polychaeton citri CBS 116435 TaxID=1314669 RepID=A0A9P4Q124_9PEZI|nr:hypothetical protein K431DRAFT_19073 [Polychaeton citri CBS 116435]